MADENGELARSGGARLSPRRLEVLALLSKGLSNKQVAKKLKISESTAKGYVEDILHALDVPNRAAAVAKYMTPLSDDAAVPPLQDGPNGGGRNPASKE